MAKASTQGPRFCRLNTSMPWGLRGWEPKLGAALWPRCPKAQTKSPGRWQQGPGPLCQLIPRPRANLSHTAASPQKEFRYSLCIWGNFKG